MKRPPPRQLRPAATLVVLLLVLLAYSWPALSAPLFGGADLLSNLLPIVHYRQSILVDGTLPLYTDLWYGGRPQWLNPLWSFLYLPATAAWLLLPIPWAARVVLFGHLFAAAAAGRSLAGLFLERERDRFLVALLLLSPVVVTLRTGHVEKLLAWPWVLLGLRFLLDEGLGPFRRGLYGGVCLGIVALTGANYYALYGLILFALLAVAVSRRALVALAIGASLGLLHLPSVAYLVGQTRQVVEGSVDAYRVSGVQGLQALFVYMPAGPPRLESFAIIGLPMAGALAVFAGGRLWRREGGASDRLMGGLLAGAALLLLMATAVLYRGHELLDTFRVPSRAMAFVAVCLVLLAVLGSRSSAARSPRRRQLWTFLLFLSVIQVFAVWWRVRPQGAAYWADNGDIQALVDRLRAAGAESVWMNAEQPDDMQINLALTEAAIALPNVYYGPMNQRVPVDGPYCGYAFDHLLTAGPLAAPAGAYALQTDTYPRTDVGQISGERLRLSGWTPVNGRPWYVYEVLCPE